MYSSLSKMKLLFFSVLLLLAGRNVIAQESSSPVNNARSRPNKLEGLYLNLGLGGGLISTGLIAASNSVTAFLHRGWGAEFGMHFVRLRSQDVPADYNGGGVLFGDGSPPGNSFYSYSLTAVRKHYLGESRMARWGWQLGPSLVQFYKTAFTPRPPAPPGSSGWGFDLFSSSNYTTKLVLQNTIGVQMAVNVAFLPSRIAGVEANLWANLNAAQPMLGLEACVLLGKVRAKRNW